MSVSSKKSIKELMVSSGDSESERDVPVDMQQEVQLESVSPVSKRTELEKRFNTVTSKPRAGFNLVANSEKKILRDFRNF